MVKIFNHFYIGLTHVAVEKLTISSGTVGCVALGALLGYAIGNFAIVSGLGSVLDSKGTVVFIVVCVLVGAIAIFFVEKYVIVFGTSLTGAFAFIIGLDMFVTTGFNQLIRLALNAQTPDIRQIPGKIWGMAIGVMFLTVIGVIVQLKPPGSLRVSCCESRLSIRPKKPQGQFRDKPGGSDTTLV
ncbi:hypothetical protein HK096_010151 [Nowakowskiella sp. JEL0078]|nr:hypothetical protein HK096_010151 [Nowakowskiella sp. JEL0078]